MKSPTPPEKLALLFLSTSLLLGLGLSYYRKNVSVALEVIPSGEERAEAERTFEISKQVSLREGKEEDFVRLPHVGPQLAKRIVAYRKSHGFQNKEDLLKVRGIGAKTYDALKELLVLE